MTAATVKCRFCGAISHLAFRTRDWNQWISSEVFTYYRCPSCQLLFLAPVPANLSDYYHAGYYSVPASVEELVNLVDGERFKVEMAQRFVPTGRLLEIGPAVGKFAYLAKKAGYDVDAIEMDAACCRFLNEVVGVKAIHSSNAREVLTDASPYDVITLWHVIEHLSDPWETLEAIASRLTAGGIVIIATPNPDAFQFRIFGRYWTHVDAPRHLQLIPESVLEWRARKLGLQVLLKTVTDPAGLGLNTFGWGGSVNNALASQSIRVRGMYKAGRLASFLARPIERTGMRGSAYTVVLKKA